MKFRVIKPFNLNGIVRMPDQILEMDINQAGKFRSMGLIGQVVPEHAVLYPSQKAVQTHKERAVKEPTEKRDGRKKKEAAPAPEIPEDIKDRVE